MRLPLRAPRRRDRSAASRADRRGRAPHAQTPLVSRSRLFLRISSNRSVFAPFASARRARRSIAARPAYASRQPLRPHGQGAPSMRTTMCPSSPAEPRPSQSLPSITTAPPMPVPHQTPRNERYVLPAPSWRSASTATRTSLPSATRTPSSLPSAAASGNASAQSGRFPARATVPASRSTSPGEPTPTPASSAASTPAAAAASRRPATSSRTTSFGPPVRGVSRRELPST